MFGAESPSVSPAATLPSYFSIKCIINISSVKVHPCKTQTPYFWPSHFFPLPKEERDGKKDGREGEALALASLPRPRRTEEPAAGHLEGDDAELLLTFPLPCL